MNSDALINSLARFARSLPEVLRDVPPDDLRWKPPSCAWSILEIVYHLADEEALDFRQRLQSTLEDPQRPWPPIDPESWAIERHYNQGQLGDALERFQTLRAANLTWLRSLGRADWSLCHEHPQYGAFAAGDLLAAWVAHDWLHLRQIAKRQFELSVRDAEPYSTRYAGVWGP